MRNRKENLQLNKSPVNANNLGGHNELKAYVHFFHLKHETYLLCKDFGELSTFLNLLEYHNLSKAPRERHLDFGNGAITIGQLLNLINRSHKSKKVYLSFKILQNTGL